jgi:hypothetical protein
LKSTAVTCARIPNLPTCTSVDWMLAIPRGLGCHCRRRGTRKLPNVGHSDDGHGSYPGCQEFSASPWAEDGLGFTWFSTARVVTRMKHDKRGAAGVERTSTGKWGEKMEISTNQRRAGWHRPAAASAASAASALGTKCHKQTSWWRTFHRWHYCTCI